MNPIGFVAIPRTELHRPTGAFFSAAVEAKAGPGLWRVALDGKNLIVQSDLDLTPGQTLRLKLVSQEAGRWLFQIVDRPDTPAPQVGDPALLAAFVSRGLPAAVEKLSIWSRWLAKPGPSDKPDWAASLEARGEVPEGLLAEAVEPWLGWQSALERGERRPPPEGDPWDLWNTRKPSGEAWVVLPLTWEYEGTSDSGLLQARWNPVAQTVDRWNLTAAPAGVPFRLEAASRTGHLDLVWRFFDAADRRAWQPVAQGWARTLSTSELTVSLSVEGPRRPGPVGGVDVSA